MAPEVTTTTRWPAARRRGDLGAELRDGAPRRSRRASSVIDDVPILATTITGGSRRPRRTRRRGSPMRTVSPCRAPARASALSTPRRSQPVAGRTSRASALVRSDSATARSACRPTTRPARRRRRARSRKPSAAGRCTTNASGSGCSRPGLAHGLGHPADQLAHALAGDRRRSGGPSKATSGSARSAREPDDEPGPVEQLGLVGAAARRAGPAPARPAACSATGDEVEEHARAPGPARRGGGTGGRGPGPRWRPR